MAHQIKVGISGAGVIGTTHADALSGLENVTLMAVAEPREEAGLAFAERWGCAHYHSYPDMLANADIDVVVVATPSGLHPDQVVLAAEHGKHVITEKPMAITTEGLDRMIQATEQAGVKLAVIFQNRLSLDVVTVHRALAQGAFGTPVLANGTMYWHRTQEYYDANGGWRGTWALDGGGALMNQAIHTVDQLQWLMGGVQEIKAFTATLDHQIETEDVAVAAFVYTNGALGTMAATTCATEDRKPRIEIIGTGGRVTLEANEITVWESALPREEIMLTEADLELVGDWRADEPWVMGHRRQLRAILNALGQNQPPYVSGNEARAAVDIILGIYQDANG